MAVDDSPAGQADKLVGGGGSGGLGGFSTFMQQNPALAAGVGIGASVLPMALNRGTNLPYQGPMQGIAGQAASQYGAMGAYAGQLQQPIVTGKLPPGAQAAVDTAKQKADAAVKSRYANLGLTGSTMEADQLALNEENVAAEQFKIEQQMAELGLRAGQQALDDLKLQDSIYKDLMTAQMQSDKQLSDSIGAFAKAAGTALGAAGGFAVGGPVGAMAGASLGGAAGQAMTSIPELSAGPTAV